MGLTPFLASERNFGGKIGFLNGVPPILEYANMSGLEFDLAIKAG
jgi:hypothetical protein